MHREGFLAGRCENRSIFSMGCHLPRPMFKMCTRNVLESCSDVERYPENEQTVPQRLLTVEANSFQRHAVFLWQYPSILRCVLSTLTSVRCSTQLLSFSGTCTHKLRLASYFRCISPVSSTDPYGGNEGTIVPISDTMYTNTQYLNNVFQWKLLVSAGHYYKAERDGPQPFRDFVMGGEEDKDAMSNELRNVIPYRNSLCIGIFILALTSCRVIYPGIALFPRPCWSPCCRLRLRTVLFISRESLAHASNLAPGRESERQKRKIEKEKAWGTRWSYEKRVFAPDGRETSKFITASQVYSSTKCAPKAVKLSRHSPELILS